jgi:hypothetical protein
LQEVYGVKAGRAPHVHEVFEVPAHQVIHPVNGTDGDMPCVVLESCAHHTSPEILQSKIFDLIGDRE